ncbi:hypothetical protein N7481_001933 [Penicillium waksmanii]|uniref:uncharacterized protein n=1 Tax=Penicillium waksmanii TaxID=69791 RepID=UPI002547081C|nr:uncharacterized protein N7481_001933 [Penicillium waksmanii]KAJ5994956.1 hypothetical protein N7481_001933 [Penicillium waksmanii]
MLNTVSRESTPPEPDVAILGGSRKRSLPTESDDEYLEERARKRKSPEVLLWCPFTDNFFDDMATIIARDFPITQFAERHNCEKRDVLHALHAVVMDPLRKSQPWYEGMSVSEHAQILISNWRAPPCIPSPSGLPGVGSQDLPILIGDDSPQPSSPSEISEISGVSPCNTNLDGFERNSKDQLAAVLRAFAKESPGCKKESYDSPTPSVNGSARSVPAALGTVSPSNSPNQDQDQGRGRDPIPGDSSGESTILASCSSKAKRSTTQQEKGQIARIVCRKGADGTWIPAHKWIRGYHRPAVRGEDDLSE